MLYIYIYVRSLQNIRFYMAYKPLTKWDAHGKLLGDPQTKWRIQYKPRP